MFLLQQQHLIELIRGQKVEEALLYAGEYLAERGEEDWYYTDLLTLLTTIALQYRATGAGENTCSPCL